MPLLPPPKKKVAPLPYKRKEPIQNGTRFQPNRQWDSTDEMSFWIKNNLPEGTKVIESWKVQVLRCQVEVPNPKRK